MPYNYLSLPPRLSSKKLPDECNHFTIRSQLKLPNTFEDLNTSCLIRPFLKSLQFVSMEKRLCRHDVATFNMQTKWTWPWAYSYLSLVSMCSLRSPKNAFNDCSDHVETPWSDPTATVATTIAGMKNFPRRRSNKAPLQRSWRSHRYKDIPENFAINHLIWCPRTECCSWKKSKNMIVGITSSATTKETCLWNWIPGPKSLKGLI